MGGWSRLPALVRLFCSSPVCTASPRKMDGAQHKSPPESVSGNRECQTTLHTITIQEPMLQHEIYDTHSAMLVQGPIGTEVRGEEDECAEIRLGESNVVGSSCAATKLRIRSRLRRGNSAPLHGGPRLYC